MRIRNKLLLGTLGFLSLLMIGIGTVYAIKPGNCDPIEDYRPFRHHDVAFVYGGGIEKSRLRAIDAAYLYRKDYTDRIVVLGTPEEIYLMVNKLTELDVPQNKIIIPDEYSYSTRENIETGNLTVKERELGTKIIHVSSRNHLPRIKKINEELIEMGTNPSDDDYYGASEIEYGKPFWQLLPNISKIKTDSDLTEWFACVTGR